ncbi:ATP-binding protein [Niallia sp. BSM11]|uniref:ATP-binding protein n=1 Tax=Niallia sp. BSM11 TaxID=3391576 RepID=UPI00398462DD
MKAYIKKLSTFIGHKISDSDQAVFLRLDYFNQPSIYLEVAKYLTSTFENIEVQLSEEKYQVWKDEYPTEMEEMLRLGFVSLDQRFTKLRNEFGEMKKSVVLLATESVQDKGGLADFYSITPADMISEYKENSAVFFETLDISDLRAINIINNLFKEIFKHVPMDLWKVSDMADNAVNLNLYQVDEIVEYVLRNLWLEFGLPNILTVNNKLLSELNKGKTFKLLDSGQKFIKRDTYKSLSSNTEKNIREKFNKFKENNDKYLDFHEPIKETFGSIERYCEDIIDFAKGDNLEKLRPKLAQFDQTITTEILGIKNDTTKPRKDRVIKIKGDPSHVYSQMILEVLTQMSEPVQTSDKIIIKVITAKLAEGILEEDRVNRWSELCLALGGLVDYLNIGVQNVVTIEYYNNLDPFALKDRTAINLDFIKTPNSLSKIDFEVKLASDNDSKWLFQWSFNPFDYWLQTFKLIPYIEDQLALNNEDKLPIFTCKQLGNLLTSTDIVSFHYQLSNSEIVLHNTLKMFSPSNMGGNLDEKKVINKLYRLIEPFAKFIMEINNNGFYNAINVQKTRITAELINAYVTVYNDLWKSYNSYPNYEKDHFNLISNLFTIIEEQDLIDKNNAIQGAIIPPFHPAMVEKIEAKQAFIRQGLVDIIFNLVSDFENTKLSNSLNELSKVENQSAILSGVDCLITKNGVNRAPSHVLGYYALHGESNRTQIIDSSNLVEIGYEDELEDDNDKTSSSKAYIIQSHIAEYIKTFPSNIDTLSLCFVNFDHLYPIIEGIKNFIKVQQKQVGNLRLELDILTSKVNYKAQNYLKLWLDQTFSVDDEVELKIHFITYKFNEVTKLKELLVYKAYDLAFIDNLLYTSDIIYKTSFGKKITPSETKFPMVFNPIPAPNNQDKRSISISQMQFEASFAHSQLVFWAQNSYAKENKYYRVEKELSIQTGIKDLLTIFHEQARWVVSIDTGLDKQIFDSENIISFSTGEGVYGELNVAISASVEMKTDIKARLESRLRKLFPSWLPVMYEQAAEYCLEDSVILDGIKVLKALNPYDYEIHSYLSSLLAVQSLNVAQKNDDTLLKSFISLDSYNHWFNDKPNRPDLLELEIIRSENDVLRIKANLVECKMGKENPIHIEKGILQLENGYKFLSSVFSPVSEAHDRRYWFAQLYRLLAFSPVYLTNDELEREQLNSDLMKILNGEFAIEWKATLLTYWLDYNAEELEVDTKPLGHSGIQLHHQPFGQLYIQKQLLPEKDRTAVHFENVSNEEYENFADDEDTFNEIAIEVNSQLEEKYDNEQVFIPITELPKRIVTTNSQVEPIDVKPSIDNLLNKSIEILNEPNSNISSKHESNEKLDTSLITEKSVPDEEHTKLQDVRILLGKEQRTNKDIYWEYGHPKLENRHLLITGTSGVGKTYFMQCLLLELANNNISSLIFDYTDGFKKSQLNDDFKEAMDGKIIQFNVQRNGFPINPFKKNLKEYDEDEYDLESDIDVAERIAGIFYAVYKKNGIGDQQKNSIYKATVSGLRKYGDKMSLDYLRSELENLDKGSAKTVLSKLDPLIDRKPFATENLFDWEELRRAAGKVYIVQLTGFNRDTQVLLTEFILWDIWSYNLSHGSVETPFPVILDEAQNLDQSETSPSARILTEGRKFGWSGLFATQTLQHPITKDAITRFQNASQKIHFLPPEGDNKNIASFLSPESNEQKNWATKLTKLSKGQCIVVGSDLLPDGSLGAKLKHAIDVTPLNERTKPK